MDNLLLGLIVVAVVAVAMVYIYNRREEARFRRESERAFGGQEGDALMEIEAPRGTRSERVEPQLQVDAAHEPPGPERRREPRTFGEPPADAQRAEPAAGSIAQAMARIPVHGRTAGPATDEMPRAQSSAEPVRETTVAVASDEAAHSAADARPSADQAERPGSEDIDTAAEGVRPAPRTVQSAADLVVPEAVRPAWAPSPASEEVAPDPISYRAELYANEALSPASLDQLLRLVGPLAARVRLEGRRDAEQPWSTLERSAYGAFPQVRACLQLIDRRGLVSKQDVIVFQSAVARCAASIPARANIPEAEPYLARARELDGFCEEVDVTVGINLVAPRGRPFLGTRLRGLAEAAGFRLADGAFAFLDGQGEVRFTLENQEPALLLGEALRGLQTAGVTLLLDVPRLADGIAAFDEMVAVGRKLAQSLGGTLVDDNNVPVTESGLEQIRDHLRGIYARMQAQGIPAGSPLALRLFS